jgi:hypothetical protein
LSISLALFLRSVLLMTVEDQATKRTRRQMTDIDRLRIYALRLKGLTYEAIAETIQAESPDHHRFDRAGIYRAEKTLPASPLDEPFRWPKLQECGLPWEASAFIMNMLAAIYEYREEAAEFRERYPERVPAYMLDFTPTVRQMIWWWRVHLAAPEIGQQVGGLQDIRLLGDAFAVRELVHQLLGRPLETEDLEASLALKPWLSDERHDHYHRVVDLGLAPPINIELTDRTSPVMQALFGEIKARYPAPGSAPSLIRPLRGDHPELFLTQQSYMNMADDFGWSYSIDAGLVDAEGVQRIPPG